MFTDPRGNCHDFWNLVRLGDTQSALEFYQHSLNIRERLAAADPTNAVAQRYLSLSYNQLGKVQLQLGNAQSALGFYQQGLEISERLAAADPTNAEAQRDLSISYERLGIMLMQLVDTQSALEYFQQSLDIRERRAAADPNNAQAQRDLSLSYNQLGDAHLQLRNTQSALGYIQQYNDICERLAAADPTNAEAQRNLSISYERLGNVQLQLGDTQSALQYYQQSLDIRERRAAADPNNAQRNVICRSPLQPTGESAIAVGERAVGVGVSSARPRHPRATGGGRSEQRRVQSDLSSLYGWLGIVQLQLGDTQSALEHFQQSLDIRERRAAADPTNAQAQRDLSLSYERLGGHPVAVGRHAVGAGVLPAGT